MNQGPKAAARNRAALVAAAREVYAEVGLDAPMAEIARRAGVGQGSLYRHFPDRSAIAATVLEENVRQVERAAAVEGATLADVLAVLTWHLAESAAFIGLLRAEGTTRHREALAHAEELAGRLERALRTPLRGGSPLGVADLMLAVAMVSGAVTGPTREDRERRVLAAWALLGVEVGPVGPFSG
ncbi:helix-turn-helix domain-containing protein [Streptomyces diastaticus]|uniref:TetR/AcrR family transcriptional regulator n=1 Tax=Streptomyces diastaticus TaxID=1956 RepID=UPI00342A354F